MEHDEGGEEVKLLGFWASPYVMRVVFALRLKGVKYEDIEENLLDKSQRLVEANPVYKKVPVLIHNGKPICESSIILQYIDDTWPHQHINFLPKHPFARAYTRFWADFIDKKVFEAGHKIINSSEEEQEKAWEEYIGYLEIIERELQKDDDPFFGGKSMDFADIALASMISWLPALDNLCGGKLKLINLPRLHKFMNAVNDCPHLKDCHVDSHKLLEYAKGLRKRFGHNE